MDTKDMATWNILLVDDEPDNLHLAAELLQFQGATVRVARNGREAMDEVQKSKPSIILLDLSMPEMDGWEVQESLRSDETFNDMPIIALTAMAMPADAARVQKAGFDGYITKPFRMREFLRGLTHYMESFHAQRQANVQG